MKKYARNEEEGIAYIEKRYEGVHRGFTPWNKSLYFSDGGYAQYGAMTCAGGESDGWDIFDAEGNAEGRIIICEDCWENAAQAERI